MRYVEAGGVRLSAVGLGTWQFGSSDWSYGETYASRTAPALVERALDLGVNLFDTAEVYAFGRSERILGAALDRRRGDAFVATKLFPVLPVSPVVERRARASAQRLGTDVLDLYQLHFHNPVVPASRIAPALAELARSGLVRHVGVSNYSLTDWQGLEDTLGSPVLSNQVQFSLIDRRAGRDLVPWAARHDRLVIAYSPLAQGLVSGRYGPDRIPSDRRAGTPPFLPENLRRVRPLLGVLSEVARSHGSSMSQVALAWVLRRPNVVAIPGASSIEQLEENVAAADLELSEEEDGALTSAAEAYVPLSGRAKVSALTSARASRVAERLRKVAGALRS